MVEDLKKESEKCEQHTEIHLLYCINIFKVHVNSRLLRDCEKVIKWKVGVRKRNFLFAEWRVCVLESMGGSLIFFLHII